MAARLPALLCAILAALLLPGCAQSGGSASVYLVGPQEVASVAVTEVLVQREQPATRAAVADDGRQEAVPVTGRVWPQPMAALPDDGWRAVMRHPSGLHADLSEAGWAVFAGEATLEPGQYRAVRVAYAHGRLADGTALPPGQLLLEAPFAVEKGKETRLVVELAIAGGGAGGNLTATFVDDPRSGSDVDTPGALAKLSPEGTQARLPPPRQATRTTLRES